MIVVGGPEWKQAFGASAVVSEGPSEGRLVDPLFLAKAKALGRRVAGLADAWKKVAEAASDQGNSAGADRSSGAQP